MFPTPDQKSNAAQAASLDAACGLTAKTLDVCLKLSELGVAAMKANVADYQENVRKALAANGAQELFAVQASAIEPAAERARSFMQQAHEITASARADIQKMFEAQYALHMRNMEQAFDSLSQSAPAGSQNALNAWQSAMTSTAAFYESMQQATRHAIQFTENRAIGAATTASSTAQKASARAVANS